VKISACHFVRYPVMQRRRSSFFSLPQLRCLRQLLQRVALQDRRALFFVGQRFVCNITWSVAVWRWNAHWRTQTCDRGIAIARPRVGGGTHTGRPPTTYRTIALRCVGPTLK
jgi:hypothetical protein